MFIFWEKKINLIFSLFNFLFLLTFFDPIITNNILYYDLLSRLSLNETLINFYNFFWTSITYLLYFILILISILYFNFLFNSFFFLIFYLCKYIYFFDVLDFLLLNANILNNYTNITNINVLLINNLNKYHPFILYISFLIILIILFIFHTLYIYNNNFYYNQIFYYYLYNLSLSSLFIYWALFLGSWWAYQEGTWGGWWNWDSSEVFGLLLLLFNFLNIHLYKHVNNIHLLKIFYINQILLLLFTFIILQLNFEITSHSFGSRLTYFFNSNFFLLELLVFLILSIYYINTLNFTSFNNFKLNQLLLSNYSLIRFNWFFFFLLKPILLYFFYIFFTLLPLIQYLVWNFFKLNILNINLNYFFIIIVWLYYYITTIKVYYNILFLFLLKFDITFSLIIILGLIKIDKFKLTNLIHYFLLIIFIINYISLNSNYVFLITTSYNSFYNFWITSILYNCNNFFISNNQLKLDWVNHITINYNYFYNNNSLNINDLILFNTSNSFNILIITKYSNFIFFNSLYNIFIETFLDFLLIFSFLVSYIIKLRYIKSNCL